MGSSLRWLPHTRLKEGVISEVGSVGLWWWNEVEIVVPLHPHLRYIFVVVCHAATVHAFTLKDVRIGLTGFQLRDIRQRLVRRWS